MKPDSLPVYSEMDSSSGVVQMLKKGDQLTVNLEIASSSGQWCGVSLKGQTATLGYVSCDGLQVDMPHPAVEPSLAAAGSAPVEGGSPASGKSDGRRRVQLSVSIPSAGSAEQIKQLMAKVVTGDGVNIEKIQELETAAQNGSPAAMARAALAHDVAGGYELTKNDPGRAMDHFRAALPFAAKNSQLLLVTLWDLAYVHLQLSEYSDAAKYLDQARRLDPNSATTAMLSGWAYYGLNQLDDAVQQWQESQQLEPNPAVAALLARAELDQKTERGFQQGATSHFVLHYEGGAMPGLAQDILGTLEEDFNDIGATLSYTPPEPIGVVLYTNRQFEDVTQAPSWADGMNDGRIRVPVQGMTAVNGELAHVLKHELTHSFVRQMTRSHCPTWLQEGVAQWMEGKRSAGNARVLVEMYDQKRYIPLRYLEGGWMRFNPVQAVVAYAWSLAAVETIVANYDVWGLQRLLAHLTEEGTVDGALKAAMQTDYPDLDRQTADYLRRTYGQ
ncbi:MAG TPA: tetratricopeptide repeat protein [Candidatus Acidoferrales bacterium]|nr:tetratricopeptide repeat protein [Candidatus Acidoferrales bacterium]